MMRLALVVLCVGLWAPLSAAINTGAALHLKSLRSSSSRATAPSEWCRQIPGDAEFELGAGIKVAGELVRELCTQYKTLPEDRIFYHYSIWSNCIRWGLQQSIHRGEVDYLASQHKGQAAGGGVYFAGNAYSSRNYGNCCIMLRHRKGTPLYDPNLTVRVLKLKTSLRNPEKAKLGQIIPFIHHSSPSSDWWVTHHHFNTRDVRVSVPSPTEDPAVIKQRLSARKVNTFEEGAVPWKWEAIKNDIELFKVLHKSRAEDPKKRWPSFISGAEQVHDSPMKQQFWDSVGYLTSAYALMRYMDGVSFLRAVRVNPNNPWGEFEPEHFGKFKDMISKYMQQKLDTNDLGFVFTTGQIVGDRSSRSNRAEWAESAVAHVEKLYQEVGPPSHYPRYGEVRAGGDLEGRNFRVAPKLIKYMHTNPLLYVVASKHGDDGYKCHYYYPDPGHSSKLLAKHPKMLGDELVQELGKHTEEEWRNKKDSQEFKDLTQRMQKKLLKASFAQAYGDYITQERTWRGIVGVHPSPDFNGRVNRLWQYLEQLDSLVSPSFHFIADFDLMTSAGMYEEFLKETSARFHNLRLAMLAQMVHLVFTKKVKAEGVAYWKLPEVDALMQSLRPVLKKGKAVDWPPKAQGDMKEWWNLIASRDWVKFLNKLHGSPDWWWAGAKETVDLTKN